MRVGVIRDGGGALNWHDGTAVGTDVPTAFWRGATAPTSQEFSAVVGGFLAMTAAADQYGYLCELNDPCECAERSM